MSIPGDADTDRGERRSLLRRFLRLSWGPRLGIVAGIVVAMLGLVVGVVYTTDNPEFCTNCHEMRPYVAAWKAGPHHDHWCVDCHVAQDIPTRAFHKVLVVKELWLHFTTHPLFPLEEVPQLPHGTCAGCHEKVQVKLAKVDKYVKPFSHDTHLSKGECQACHKASGHEVAAPSLANWGSYNPLAEQAAYRTAKAVVGKGAADVPNHVPVTCTNCHDLAKTGCSACHKPKHKPRGACENCHRGGTKFVFTHTTKTECEKCHTPPATHRQLVNRGLAPCGDCHQHPGKDFAFTHINNPIAPCGDCHDLPTKHFQPMGSGELPACENCHHNPGANWAFTHPELQTCQHCHIPPASMKNHPTSGLCGHCHKPGVTFTFVHPPTNAPHQCLDEPCIACHPDLNYSSATCTCHQLRAGLQQGHPDQGLH